MFVGRAGRSESQCNLERNISAFSFSPTTLGRKTNEVQRALDGSGQGSNSGRSHPEGPRSVLVCLDLFLFTGVWIGYGKVRVPLLGPIRVKAASLLPMMLFIPGFAYSNRQQKTGF